MTSNEYYGKINRRFDYRARLLRRMGFNYRIAVKGIAVFVHRNARDFDMHNRMVTASAVAFAPGRAFAEAVTAAISHY
jgi:hypothetical protein